VGVAIDSTEEVLEVRLRQRGDWFTEIYVEIVELLGRIGEGSREWFFVMFGHVAGRAGEFLTGKVWVNFIEVF
jgi:hypothetical protein